MATASLFGNAGFKYGTGPTTHRLGAPLREVHPIGVQTRYSRWSLDQTTRDVTVIGAGVDDLSAVIRYENQPANLRAMLKAGMNGTLLKYYPDLGSSTFYPFTLVSVEGGSADEVAIKPDRDRYGYGEYEASVRLRRTDGSGIDGLL